MLGTLSVPRVFCMRLMLLQQGCSLVYNSISRLPGSTASYPRYILSISSPITSGYGRVSISSQISLLPYLINITSTVLPVHLPLFGTSTYFFKPSEIWLIEAEVAVADAVAAEAAAAPKAKAAAPLREGVAVVAAKAAEATEAEGEAQVRIEATPAEAMEAEGEVEGEVEGEAEVHIEATAAEAMEAEGEVEGHIEAAIAVEEAAEGEAIAEVVEVDMIPDQRSSGEYHLTVNTSRTRCV